MTLDDDGNAANVADGLGGTDQLFGIENLFGGGGDDSLTGNTQDNILRGGAGDDTLTGGGGSDTADYGSSTGDLEITLGVGGDASNVGDGLGGIDELRGISNLFGGSGDDSLTGNAENNILRGGAGNDTLTGGGRIDTADYGSSLAAVVIALDANGDATGVVDGLGGTDELRGITNLTGGLGDDSLTGNAAANVLSGGVGDDWLDGGAGNDTLIGDAGRDTADYRSSTVGLNIALREVGLYTNVNDGQGSSDSLFGIENIAGGSGNDTLTGNSDDNVLSGGAGADTLDGGGGKDTADYSASTGAVAIALDTSGEATVADDGFGFSDRLIGFENLRGGLGDDSLTGNGSANLLDGGAGDDRLVAGRGANDTLIGGAGTDTADYREATGNLTIGLDATGSTTEASDGHGGTDQLSGIEHILAGAGDDTLSSRDRAANLIEGGAGDDVITGGTGADTLSGGEGNDRIAVDFWTPRRISSLAVWLDGADVDGDGMSEGASESGVANGNLVTWVNKAGALAPTAATQPNYVTNALNGQSVVRFVGGQGDRLDLPALNTILGADAAMVSVQTVSDEDFLLLSQGSDRHSWAGSKTNLGSASGVERGLGAPSYFLDGAGVSFADRQSVWSATDGRTSLVVANDLDFSSWDATSRLGGYGGTWNFNGDVPEFLLFSEGLSTGDRQLLEGYLAWKWGLEASLPVDHPYRDSDYLWQAEDILLSGGAGDDTLGGGYGDDTLDGGDGLDTADYSVSSADLVITLDASGDASGVDDGDGGTDTLLSIEALHGGLGDDSLTGNAGANVLRGGEGDDTLTGGTGTDTVDYGSSTSGVSITLDANGNASDLADGLGGIDQLFGFENITGGLGDDTLRGNAGANLIAGGSGDDLLFGGEGSDTLLGGAGSDTADYGASTLGLTITLDAGGNDLGVSDGLGFTDDLYGIENLFGGAGNDSLTGNGSDNLLRGGAGLDTLLGGAGIDTADYRTSETAVSIALDASGNALNISDGLNGTDQLYGFENLLGGLGDDSLTGNDGANLLDGGMGDDWLVAGQGANDTLIGGSGSDTADYSAANGNLSIVLDAFGFTDAADDGHGGTDRLEGIENLIGGSGDDTLIGSGDGNLIEGGAGHDWIEGRGTGGDALFGGTGNDRLIGGTDWTPADLPGLALWLDGADIDGDGIAEGLLESGVTQTGGIAIWTDKSGNGRNAVQADVALQPMLIEGGLNGLSLLRFDTARDSLTLSSLTALGTEATVTTVQTPQDKQWFILNGSGYLAGGFDGNGGGLNSNVGNPTYVLNGQTSFLQNWDVVHDALAGRASILVSESVNLSSWSTARLSGYDVNWDYSGDLPEVVMTQGPISEADRQRLEGYLAWKWGLEALLPADHPFASTFAGLGIVMSGADSHLEGGAGDDTLSGGYGDDTLDGGADIDTVDYSMVAGSLAIALDVDGNVLDVVDGLGGLDQLFGFENVLAGAGDDSLVGNAAGNRLAGGAGDDTLAGGAGDDTLEGGSGRDTADYSASTDGLVITLDADGNALGIADGLGTTDYLYGIENLIGGSGNDSLTGNAGQNLLRGGAGNDTLTGGLGVDTVDYRTSLGPLSITLDGSGNASNVDDGFGGTDQLYGFENILGGAGDDTLTGNDLANLLDGGAGDDWLLAGTNASDTLIGGLGSDTADYRASTGNLSIILDADGNALEIRDGDGGRDRLEGIENLLGGSGDDTLGVRGLAVTSIDGGAGDDVIFAGQWSVRDLPGLALWLDAADLDGDGVSEGHLEAGLTTEGSIATWTDKSGNGRNAVQSNTDVQPLLVEEGVNGLSVVRFEADLDWLALPSLTALGANATVTTIQTPRDNQWFILNGTGYLAGGLDGSTGGLNYVVGSPTFILDGTATSLSNLDVVHDRLGGRTSLLVSEAVNLSSWTMARLSGHNSAWNYTGDLTEIVMTSGPLTAADRQLLEGYLAWKWGLEALLPTEHPYSGMNPNATGSLLSGGAGDDTIILGYGNDTIDGGEGADTVDYSSAIGAVVAHLDAAGNAVDVSDGLGGIDQLFGVEHLLGGAGDDWFVGNAAANLLSGELGDDTLFGSAGNDTLKGGAGSDTADYSTSETALTITLDAEGNALGVSDGLSGIDDLYGIENILGGAGQDRLEGNAEDNLLGGGSGDDTLIGGAGRDTADYRTSTGALSITLDVDGNVANLEDGLEGTDQLFGFENVLGGLGGDALTGNAGSNLLDGGAGDDLLRAGFGGNDTLIGGAGSDTVDYASVTGGLVILLDDLGTTIDAVDGEGGLDQLYGIEAVIAGSGDDLILGGAGDNLFRGGAGDDTLTGGAGTDTLDYTTATAGVLLALDANGNAVSVGDGLGGVDQVYGFENVLGGAGNDSLSGNAGGNLLSAGLGDDTLSGGAGADTLYGGAGNDTAVYRSSAGSIVASLDENGDAASIGDGHGGFDQLFGIENIVGGYGDDRLTGNGSANRLEGGEGADSLAGGGGNDTLIGGLGSDTADYSSAGVALSITLDAEGNAANVADGLGGTDQLQGIENLVGGLGDDRLMGNAGKNLLIGGAGNDLLDGGTGGADTLSGGDGDDTLIGSAAANLLEGGGGNDVITGGEGQDTLSGGEGDDVIRVQAPWSPHAIPGLAVWLDGADIDGDGVSEGSSESGISGANLGTWVNKAGGISLRTVSQPSYVTDALNGQSVVRFVGAENDRLDLPALNTLLGADAAMVSVQTVNDADFLLLGDGSSRYSWVGSQSNTGINIEGNLGRPSYFLDGSAVSFADRESVWSATNERTSIMVANDLDFSSWNVTSRLGGYGGQWSFNGDVPEFFLFSQSLSEGDRVLLEAYLGVKWGLTDQLPERAGERGSLLTGGAGDDTLAGSFGDDTIEGGDGLDTVDYSDVSGALSIQLDAMGDAVSVADGWGSRDVLRGIENILGGEGNDRLEGNLAANLLSGGAGADTLIGGDGDDTLIGGGGADSLLGGAGDDLIVVSADQLEALGAGGVDGGSNAEGVAPDVDTLRIAGLTQGAFDLGLLLTDEGASRVRNAEILDLSNGTSADQIVQASIADLIALSDNNEPEDSPIAIKLDSGDTLSISDDPSSYSADVQSDYTTVTGMTGTLYDYTLESDPTISVQVLLTNG